MPHGQLSFDDDAAYDPEACEYCGGVDGHDKSCIHYEEYYENYTEEDE